MIWFIWRSGLDPEILGLAPTEATMDCWFEKVEPVSTHSKWILDKSVNIQHVVHDPGYRCRHCHVTQHDHKACYRNATEPEAVIHNKREALWGVVRVLERVIVPSRQADRVAAGQQAHTTQRWVTHVVYSMKRTWARE